MEKSFSPAIDRALDRIQVSRDITLGSKSEADDFLQTFIVRWGGLERKNLLRAMSGKYDWDYIFSGIVLMILDSINFEENFLHERETIATRCLKCAIYLEFKGSYSEIDLHEIYSLLSESFSFEEFNGNPSEPYVRCLALFRRQLPLLLASIQDHSCVPHLRKALILITKLRNSQKWDNYNDYYELLIVYILGYFHSWGSIAFIESADDFIKRVVLMGYGSCSRQVIPLQTFYPHENTEFLKLINPILQRFFGFNEYECFTAVQAFENDDQYMEFFRFPPTIL